MICSISGCGGPVRARGWCSKHYQRWRNHGDPLTMLKPQSPNGTLLAWLSDTVASADRSQGCIRWPFGFSNKGLGVVLFEGQRRYAPQIALQFDGKPRTDEAPWALHHCDNPACINPDHLYWGTHAENTADMVNRGRQARGERSALSKITAQDALAIYTDSRSVAAIASAFGLGLSQVRRIRRGESWAHVTGFLKLTPEKGKAA